MNTKNTLMIWTDKKITLKESDYIIDLANQVLKRNDKNRVVKEISLDFVKER